MKHVASEAVIVSWYPAAGLQYPHCYLAIASGAVSHGDGALEAVSLWFNCARLSLDAIQVQGWL